MPDFELKTGIDLVSIEEFRASLARGGEPMRRRLFHPSEEAGAGPERLAGVFAAKEAAFKALGLPLGNWHVLEIVHAPDGRQLISFASDFDAAHVSSLDLSISYSREYVVATVVARLRSPSSGSSGTLHRNTSHTGGHWRHSNESADSICEIAV